MTRLRAFAFAAAIGLIAATAFGLLDSGPALACDPILPLGC